MALVVSGLLIVLGLAVPSHAASAETMGEAATSSNTLPTAISWAMNASRAPYRHALAAEYMIQLNLFGTWIPIPPSDQDKVVLQRRAAGTTVWRTVSTTAKTVMDKDDKPHYLLVDFAAMGNATYRLAYNSLREGVDSSVSTERNLRVTRLMHDKGVNRAGRLFIVGNVDPGWGNRIVTVQRRTCATCAWRFYRSVRTGTYGGYQARIYAPRIGTWRYRAYVPATTDFLRSWTHTFIVRAPR